MAPSRGRQPGRRGTRATLARTSLAAGRPRRRNSPSPHSQQATDSCKLQYSHSKSTSPRAPLPQPRPTSTTQVLAPSTVPALVALVAPLVLRPHRSRQHSSPLSTDHAPVRARLHCKASHKFGTFVSRLAVLLLDHVELTSYSPLVRRLLYTSSCARRRHSSPRTAASCAAWTTGAPATSPTA